MSTHTMELTRQHIVIHIINVLCVWSEVVEIICFVWYVFFFFLLLLCFAFTLVSVGLGTSQFHNELYDEPLFWAVAHCVFNIRCVLKCVVGCVCIYSADSFFVFLYKIFSAASDYFIFMFMVDVSIGSMWVISHDRFAFVAQTTMGS